MGYPVIPRWLGYVRVDTPPHLQLVTVAPSLSQLQMVEARLLAILDDDDEYWIFQGWEEYRRVVSLWRLLRGEYTTTTLICITSWPEGGSETFNRLMAHRDRVESTHSLN